MNVAVRTIAQNEKGVLITFNSPYGEGVGYWRGGAEPLPNGVFYVEFDVDWPLSCDSCRPYDGEWLGFCIENELLLIRAAVEAVDEDGMVFIRVANDCLLMLDTKEAFSPVVGSRWEITVPQERMGIYFHQ